MRCETWPCWRLVLLGMGSVFLLTGCPPPRPEIPPGAELVMRGRQLFFEETFAGNGRTCGTCHPASNNLTLDPAAVAALPASDPFIVADTTPELLRRFENNRLIRDLALILENQDGFADLDNVFNQRGIPHTLGLSQSIASATGPQTGWSGDGAPGDGSLRSFATGAVIQHFTKRIDRVAGVDFRLPNDQELDAMAAFQLALGRQAELALPLPLQNLVAARGQAIFTSRTEGKCSICHFQAGANGDPNVFGPNGGNRNFATGVEDLPDQPADLTGEKVPPDDGRGTPGNKEFNTPSLVEAADTGPFFHNNAIETIEGAVGFYNGDAFNNSPAGQVLVGATGSGINLDGTQVVAVAAFLRVINALENVRLGIEMLEALAANRVLPQEDFAELPERAAQETLDAIEVLRGSGLHADAVVRLEAARLLALEAADQRRPAETARRAIAELEAARRLIIREP